MPDFAVIAPGKYKMQHFVGGLHYSRIIHGTVSGGNIVYCYVPIHPVLAGGDTQRIAAARIVGKYVPPVFHLIEVVYGDGVNAL